MAAVQARFHIQTISYTLCFLMSFHRYQVATIPKAYMRTCHTTVCAVVAALRTWRMRTAVQSLERIADRTELMVQNDTSCCEVAQIARQRAKGCTCAALSWCLGHCTQHQRIQTLHRSVEEPWSTFGPEPLAVTGMI